MPLGDYLHQVLRICRCPLIGTSFWHSKRFVVLAQRRHHFYSECVWVVGVIEKALHHVVSQRRKPHFGAVRSAIDAEEPVHALARVFQGELSTSWSAVPIGVVICVVDDDQVNVMDWVELGTAGKTARRHNLDDVGLAGERRPEDIPATPGLFDVLGLGVDRRLELVERHVEVHR
jgi:hypothetical protein